MQQIEAQLIQSWQLSLAQLSPSMFKGGRGDGKTTLHLRVINHPFQVGLKQCQKQKLYPQKSYLENNFDKILELST